MHAVLLGYGDIAKRLSHLMLFNGYQLSVASRRDPIVNSISQPISGHSVDLADKQQTCNFFARLSNPIHQVVITLTPDQRDAKGYEISYLTTAHNIINACQQYCPNARVIFVSSTSVYGEDRGLWVNELTTPEPSHYRGEILLRAEQAYHHHLQQAVIVRFSGIYGRGKSRMIETVRAEHPTTNDNIQWTNRIHADDCANVLYHLLTLNSADPIYIATDNEPVEKHKVQRWIAEQIGKEHHCQPNQPSTTVSGKRISNQRLIDSGYKFLYPTFREGMSSML